MTAPRRSIVGVRLVLLLGSIVGVLGHAPVRLSAGPQRLLERVGPLLPVESHT
jgi:hypothetical protein